MNHTLGFKAGLSNVLLAGRRELSDFRLFSGFHYEVDGN